MNDHPITPPPELVQDWLIDGTGKPSLVNYLAAQAAQWGADQELEACCGWLAKPEVALTGKGPNDLLAARRPKPLSLKERALQAWVCVEAGTDDQTAMAVIRRALEALDD
jgi:hypothetical protein